MRGADLKSILFSCTVKSALANALELLAVFVTRFIAR